MEGPIAWHGRCNTPRNSLPTMKHTLLLSSLAILGSYVSVELARASGIQVPATLNAGNAFVAFVVVVGALIVLADYGRKLPALRTAPVTVATARTPGRSIAAAHHHVYAIRRGTQAARLAHPSRVVVFPRQTSTRLRRVA